jgi:hypothetical protein
MKPVHVLTLNFTDEFFTDVDGAVDLFHGLGTQQPVKVTYTLSEI